jgi:hypothetical protein
MDNNQDLQTSHTPATRPLGATTPPGKALWQEPKLTFVEPKLTTHGNVQDVTGQNRSMLGYFNPMSP